MRDKHTARRNMIAGVLAGLVIATVFGAYAKTTFKKMVKGQAATAADVNTAHQDLATAIDKLQAEIASLKGEQVCPPGYVQDTTATAITLCKKGGDEMVKVGDYWIDRYEASLVDATLFASGKCNGAGKQYGVGVDDYPATFQDSGNWSSRVFACSLKGRSPSTRLTWFQAQQACQLAGKRLCSNGQWQGAAAGTHDKGAYNGGAGGACHTQTGLPRKTGMAGATPGGATSCISRWGAEDMIGNLWEWVNWWGQAGKGWITTDGQNTAPWPSTGGYGDGKDRTWNLNGSGATGIGTWTKGLPAAARRGGDMNQMAGSGIFTLGFDASPTYTGVAVGARCCR